MVKIDPAIVVRSFIGMIIHHSLNNNLWDPNRRLLKISNEDAAKHFTTILLDGISTHDQPKSRKTIERKVSGNGNSRKN
jgi:hypothetical protein